MSIEVAGSNADGSSCSRVRVRGCGFEFDFTGSSSSCGFEFVFAGSSSILVDSCV